MTAYKLFRQEKDGLHPLFVNSNETLKINVWLKAKAGPKADRDHVKSKLGRLAYRPGWHSCIVPYAGHIGKRSKDGTLEQRNNTVWCEIEYRGFEYKPSSKNGLHKIPRGGWYHFKTNSKQIFPWVISGDIKIKRTLDQEEVNALCIAAGIKPQKVEN